MAEKQPTPQGDLMTWSEDERSPKAAAEVAGDQVDFDEVEKAEDDSSDSDDEPSAIGLMVSNMILTCFFN